MPVTLEFYQADEDGNRRSSSTTSRPKEAKSTWFMLIDSR